METIFFEKLFDLLNGSRIRELKEQLVEMNVVDIAEFMMELEGEKQLLVFRILPKDLSAEVFAYLDPDIQQSIVEYSSDKEVGYLVEELYVDDAVDFLEEVPAGVVKRVLASASTETRNVINKFLQYPADSAGSVMTIEYVELHDRITASEAIGVIRKTGLDKETIYTCYVVDDKLHLVGILPLRRLLLADDDVLVRDVMSDDQQIMSVHTLEDQETVAGIAKKYDLLSVPVVDNESRLVGIITIDDIVDIIEAETTEDFEKMALLQPAEQEYLKSSVFTLAKNRIVWLLILMVSATFTGRIIENFEGLLAVLTGLTACIPMLMDTCGNAGTQSSTLIIRGMAIGEITTRDYLRVLYKEVRVSLLCGGALAVVNFIRMLLLGSSGGTPVYFVVSLTVLFSVVVSKCIGCTLPIVAKAVHLDPAVMSSPLLTTIADAMALGIYFSLAKVFLL